MPVLREFKKSDFPTIQSIYQEGIDTGNATFESNTKSWDDWDGAFLQKCRIVAEIDGKVVGWAALSPVSSRPVYSGVADVSVYVGKNAQGSGVGTSLLREMIPCSEAAGIWTLQAGVFPENKASISIHIKNGFRKVGIREKLGIMDGTWRDVMFLERRSTMIGSEIGM